MGMDQKIRSLHCGLPAGLHFTTIDGRNILQFRHLPFEFEDIVLRWIMAQPADLRAEYVFRQTALTQEGWSAFVSWMMQTLHQAQQED